jgi:glutaredoxin 3
MKKDITLYTTTMCPVCGMVKEFLTHLHIDYQEVNLTFRPLERIKLISKTGRFTVPQMNINGEWISGFDPSRMLEVLNSKVIRNR